MFGNMKLTYLLLLSCFVLSETVAQEVIFSKPRRLSRNINSPAEESMPLLSKDGNTMYFVRTFYETNFGGKTAGQDIWISIKDSQGYWQKATNYYPTLNNKRNNAVIGTDTTGGINTLYMMDAYNPLATTLKGITKTELQNSIYIQPASINVPGLESQNAFIGFYINTELDVLFVTMNGSDSYGMEDIYISTKDELGKWIAPINLGPVINSSGYEISPFISKDGNTLYFSSNGHDGQGDADIFNAQKQYDNSWVLWTEPENLGVQINSPSFEAYFSIYEDEVFFTSNRNSDYADIYSAKMTTTHVKTSEQIAAENYTLTEAEIEELLGVPVSRTVFFDFESYDVAAPSRELIYFLTNKLKDRPEYYMHLVGHTDIEGHELYNLNLSKRRAEEVSKYFIEYGISPLRISTRGMGEKQMLYLAGSEKELSKNRRVEIFFTKRD